MTAWTTAVAASPLYTWHRLGDGRYCLNSYETGTYNNRRVEIARQSRNAWQITLIQYRYPDPSTSQLVDGTWPTLRDAKIAGEELLHERRSPSPVRHLRSVPAGMAPEVDA